MSLHRLPAGREVIDGLVEFAAVFGYSAQREFPVGPDSSGPQVDVAWFAAGDHRVPFMIFEVESTASNSMANNTTKVLAQDTNDFVKPLFFFHVLLAGGPDNFRIATLRRQWGTHNYQVYRLNGAGESERLVRDILSQHRRVCSEVDIRRLFEGLRHPLWCNVDPPRIYRTAEQLLFASNYWNDLVHLCLDHVPALRPTLLDKLRRYYVDRTPRRGSYPDYIGIFAGLLEIPLLTGQRLLSDEEATRLLVRWQRQGDDVLKRIGPNFGLSLDYDRLIACVAPSLFAIASIVSRGRPLTRAWLAQELFEILSGQDGDRLRLPYLLPAQTWLLHINAAALRELSSSATSPNLECDLSEIHQQVCASLALHQLTYEQLSQPLGAADLLSDPSDRDPFDRTTDFNTVVGFPEWTDVSTGYFPAIHQDRWSPDSFGALPIDDNFRLALSPLIDDSWVDWSTECIVRAIHQ